MQPFHWSLFKASATLFLMLVLSGCSSVGGTGSGATVTIKDRSPDQIQAAAKKVFTDEGYKGGRIGPSAMVFEREASGLTTITREGILAASQGARTMERVRIQLLSMGDNSYRLECSAYTVTGAGDSFFENETKNIRSAPYQSLLDKVAKELE